MYKFSKNIQGASSEESFGSIFKRSPNGNALSFELADSEKSYQSASKAVSALISHARKDPRCMNCIPNLADDFANNFPGETVGLVTDTNKRTCSEGNIVQNIMNSKPSPSLDQSIICKCKNSIIF